MKNKFWLRFCSLSLILVASILSLNCALQYRKVFLDDATSRGYTKEQALVAYYMSFRYYFARDLGDGKYEVLFSRLPLSVIEEQSNRYKTDLSAILDYKDKEMSHYLDVHGLRPYFEHQERIEQAIYARVVATMVFNKFQMAIGAESGSMRLSSDDDENMSGNYDPKIFVVTNFEEAMPFKVEVLAKAKAAGILKPIETVLLERSNLYKSKEPDPSDPSDDNKFLWEAEKYQLEAIRYKIMDGDKPQNNYGNYIEVFRIFNGKKESQPALRAFLDGNGGRAIVLVDRDKEGKDIGFGLPDEISSTNEDNVMTEEVFADLFTKKDSEKRIPPIEKPIQLEIVKVGETITAWEESKDPKGWPVPEGYKTKPLGDNYNIKIKFAKHEMGEEHQMMPTRKIEAIVKEWTRPGRIYDPSQWQVLEYFKPKAPFDGDIAAAYVIANESSKKLSIVMPDGEEHSGLVVPSVNIFIVDKPFAVEFDFGEKRYRIEDGNGDGIFEKRKEIPKLTSNEVGVYAPYAG